jgi:acetyl-CoA acetyltransferase
MSASATETIPASAPELRGRAAIVGVGESDFHLDYKAARAKAPGYEPPTPEKLAQLAFERALADSGLKREDIDGLSVSFLYGGADPPELARLLGLKPHHLIDNVGIMAGPLPFVCADIAAGKCDTVAMVYAVASRAINRQYGGATYEATANTPQSYYYYHPWGWSSQAAHWALMARAYLSDYGAAENALADVALQVRRHASANPNAVMQTPLTLEDYVRARYVVRPLRLLDLCLVNDAAVCLIVRRTDRTAGLPHAPAVVAGWGRAKSRQDKLDQLVRRRLRTPLREAGAQALDMAGVVRANIRHFEGYDVSTIHLAVQLEGYGFVRPGEALDAFKAGQFGVAGALPVNLGGGMLSGAYTHGWSQVVEIVRQLRGGCGPRQARGLEFSMFSLAQTDQADTLILGRGD